MMEASKHKRYLFLGIILSLMINFCMLIFISISKYHQSPFSKKIEQQALEEEKKQAQDLKMPQMYKQKTALTPGSAVWFKNNVAPISPKAPDHGVNNITASQQGSAIKTPAQKKPHPQKAVIKAKETEKSSASKVSVDTKEIEKKVPPNKQEKATPIKQKEKAETKSSEKKAVVAQKIEKETPTKAIKNNKLQTNVIPPKAEEAVKKTKAPVSPAKEKKGKFSLKGLQKGFTQFLRKGNNSSVSRKSDLKGDPDADDLKLISYYNHISTTVDSSISYVGRVDPRGLKPDAHPIRYELVIERDGTVSSYRLTHRSQHEHLNQHAIKVIEGLGSLPPIPSYINAPHIFKSGFSCFHAPLQFYT